MRYFNPCHCKVKYSQEVNIKPFACLLKTKTAINLTVSSFKTNLVAKKQLIVAKNIIIFHHSINANNRFS